MAPKKRAQSKDKAEQVEGLPIKKVKTQIDNSLWQDIAHWLRIDSIRSVNVTKSGHPSSCSSIAEIFAVLFFHQEGLKFHADNTSHFLNDRCVLSKGHAAPILYSAFYRSKVITQQQLLSLRLKGSLIEGHPVPKIPFVDVATGSLGQGLSVAAGMAYSSKNFDKINNKIWCICGDGEVAQGSVWEAAGFASYYKLSNLIAIVDINRLGQSQPTMLEHDEKAYEKRFAGFGWKTIVVDGHDINKVIQAFKTARNQSEKHDKPIVILAKTFKGYLFGEKIQNQLDWHGKDIGEYSKTVIDSLKQRIKNTEIQFKTYAPEGEQPKKETGQVKISPEYPQGSKISTRKAYGNGLLHARQSNQNVVGLDAETKNSTFAITLKNKFPESFIECFIAEQNMVGVATGVGCRKKIPFCSTFAAFFSRAADQIRIAGISNSNLKMVGSHAGCSIGQDGPSQMALQDIAFFRTIPEGVVLVPSDGYSAERAVELAANYKGPVFIRTNRPDVPLLYKKDTVFELGKCKVLRQGQNDKICIVSYGVTIHESIKAADKLKADNIDCRIIDLISIKPLDTKGLKQAIEACNGNVLVVQEHYPEGGAGDAVCSAIPGSIKKFNHACVRKVPGSAKPEEQLQIQGLDANSIAAKIKQICNE